MDRKGRGREAGGGQVVPKGVLSLFFLDSKVDETPFSCKGLW